jgi:hypothetical protein
MDIGSILVISIIVSAIWLWILYAVIKSATKSTTQIYLSRKQVEYLEIQMRLMGELLKKHGVTDETIFKIINFNNSYFQDQPKNY